MIHFSFFDAIFEAPLTGTDNNNLRSSCNIVDTYAKKLLETSSKDQQEFLNNLELAFEPSTNRDIGNKILKEYRKNDGSEEDRLIVEKGISCLKIAAKTDASAQYTLGSMYKEGRDVEQSLEKASEFYQLAAEQGLKEAQNALKTMKKPV